MNEGKTLPSWRLRRDNLAVSTIGDERVLLDLSGSFYYSTSGTGSVLVEQLLDGASERELVDSLLDGFDVDEATARDDVLAFLAELSRLNLVEAHAG